MVVVVPFDDEDEAVAIANGTEFGLYDYVFTGDTARGLRVAKQLRTGNVGINTAQRNHEAPFGGFKMSGVGRDGGSFGLHAYSELQSHRLARLTTTAIASSARRSDADFPIEPIGRAER